LFESLPSLVVNAGPRRGGFLRQATCNSGSPYSGAEQLKS